MIMPQDLPQAPDKVFMLATPAHMLTKLHWELYQLKKSLTEKPEHIGHTHAPSYCAFNYAVTAWHLADWTWKAALPGQRAHILAGLNIKGSGHDGKDFSKFQAALRGKSRSLHICQQLANGSKYTTITHYHDPDVQAKMQWETEPAHVGKMRAGDPLAVHRYQLVILDKGIERAALDVFEEAFKDLQRYLGTCGFVEGMLGPARG
jgi:hypothetical protein